MSRILIKMNKNIFNDVYYPYRECMTPLQVIYGGASSGKSVFIAQRVIRDLLKGGRNYLCCRNTAKTLRGSIFTELKKCIRRFKADDLFHVNKSDMTITCSNGYQAIMTGLDDVEKLKSTVPETGSLTDIWIEEATETTKTKLMLLRKRLRGRSKHPKRITLSFNPIIRSHWICQDYFNGWSDTDKLYHDDNLLILKTTYKDNRFLDEYEIRDLESEIDTYAKQVYTLGVWGILGDLIFTNWEVQDILSTAKYKTFDYFRNGLDFGFSNDPTALTRSYYHHASKVLYICNEYWNKEVTNDVIAEDIKPIVSDDQVVCDSAEPKSIRELSQHGINAVGAVKGPDSIMHGIQWLKQQQIIIDRSCQYTQNNFSQYHWKEDKEGNKLNIPVDRFNDFIDSIRYAFEDEMIEYDDSMVGVYGQARALGA